MIVLLRSEANRYSISIRTELAEDLPKVMADRVQLQQVFMNLMLNGIDAMKENDWRRRAYHQVGSRRRSTADLGQRYRCGIAPEQAEQIFKAFFTTKDNGTGMGLPISRSIIESHGGRLWATGVLRARRNFSVHPARHGRGPNLGRSPGPCRSPGALRFGGEEGVGKFWSVFRAAIADRWPGD